MVKLNRFMLVFVSLVIMLSLKGNRYVVVQTYSNGQFSWSSIPGKGELPSARRVIYVSSVSQLNSAISNAQPGDHIVLRDGVYNGPIYINSLQGLPDAPVVIRAEHLLGAQINYGIRFQDTSAHDVMIWGVKVKGVSWIRGRRIIVRRSYFTVEYDPNNGETALYVYFCQDCRIDYTHIHLENNEEYAARTGQSWTPPSSYVAYYGLEIRDFKSDPKYSTKNVIVHRCYFDGGFTGGSYYRPSDILMIAADKGKNTLRASWKGTISVITRLTRFDTWRTAVGPTFYYKVSNGIVDRVHVVSRAGSSYIQMTRHGFNAVCKNSRFEGGRISIKSGQHIFENVYATKFTLYSGTHEWNDSIIPAGTPYWHAAHGCKFYNCRGDIQVGTNTSWSYRATDNVIYNHTGNINLYHESGTQIYNSVHPGHPVDTPVYLELWEVGPYAPWYGPDN